MSRCLGLVSLTVRGVKMKKVRLKKEFNGIPAGTEGLTTAGDLKKFEDHSCDVDVRICGIDAWIPADFLEDVGRR